ncbi:hypothetical protein V8C86DRAFT_2458835 [Haematococcus lacustris]
MAAWGFVLVTQARPVPRACAWALPCQPWPGPCTCPCPPLRLATPRPGHCSCDWSSKQGELDLRGLWTGAQSGPSGCLCLHCCPSPWPSPCSRPCPCPCPGSSSASPRLSSALLGRASCEALCREGSPASTPDKVRGSGGGGGGATAVELSRAHP